MIYNDMTELVHAISDRMDLVAIGDFNTDPELQRLTALWRVYRDALEESKQYGWIGVGCITFAENRLRDAQAVTDSSGSDELRSYRQGFDECGENNG